MQGNVLPPLLYVGNGRSPQLNLGRKLSLRKADPLTLLL